MKRCAAKSLSAADAHRGTREGICTTAPRDGYPRPLPHDGAYPEERMGGLCANFWTRGSTSEANWAGRVEPARARWNIDVPFSGANIDV